MEDKTLDRAVQSEVARAFGELLQGIKTAAAEEKSDLHSRAKTTRGSGIRSFRTILHTAMSGPIPNENLLLSK